MRVVVDLAIEKEQPSRPSVTRAGADGKEFDVIDATEILDPGWLQQA